MRQFLVKKLQNLAIEDAANANQEQSPDEEFLEAVEGVANRDQILDEEHYEAPF